LGAFDNHGRLCAKTEDGPASLSLSEEQAGHLIHIYIVGGTSRHLSSTVATEHQ